MTPEERAQAEAARAYMARMGVPQARVRATNVRPPRAREVSREEFERIRRGGEPTVSGIDDVEIGEAQMVAPDSEDRTLEAVANARPGVRPDTSTTRRAELALATGPGGSIPESWLRDAGGETQAQGDANAARRRQARERESTYDRIQRERGLLARMDAEGSLDAAQQGAVQGMTLGFADEMYGAGRAAISPDTYRGARDTVRRDVDRAQRENPTAFGVGNVTGAALPALLMPASGAQTVGGRVLQSGLTGAGFGGVQGAGTSTAEDVEGLERDIARGTGYGFVGGAGGQLVGEGISALTSAVRPRAPGAPEPGGDFTPEQQAAIDANPRVRDMAGQRARIERRAANQRVAASLPDESSDSLRGLIDDYEGGARGMARDLDESGIAPRRTRPSVEQVQQRAESAARPTVAGIDDMPEGYQAAQFADDEAAAGLPRSAQPPTGRARGGLDDLGPDPETRHPFDPTNTYEANLRQLQTEHPDRWQSMLLEDEAARANGRRLLGEGPERIGPAPAPDAATPRPGARGRRSAVVEGIDEPAAPATPAVRPARDAVVVEPIVNPHPTRDWRAIATEDIEPMSFEESMSGAADVPEPGHNISDEAAARTQANILAAERRARRGGYSRATQEDRTWPMRMQDVEDITPSTQAPEPAPPTGPSPPPLPRRPRPQMDVGEWQAPGAPQATPQAPQSGPARPRIADVVNASARRGELARDIAPIGGQGSARERVARVVADRWLRMPAQRAAANELRSDVLANEIVRELQRNAGTRSWGVMLERDMARGGRSFGTALMTLVNREPQVAAVINALPAEAWEANYRPRPQREETPREQGAGTGSEWDTPYRPRRRGAQE